MLSSDEVDCLRMQLAEGGFENGRIGNHLAQLPVKPDRMARYFVAHLRSGITRTVRQGYVIETDSMRWQNAVDAIRGVVAEGVVDDV